MTTPEQATLILEKLVQVVEALQLQQGEIVTTQQVLGNLQPTTVMTSAVRAVEPKICTPDEYHGKYTENLDTWVGSMEQQFEYYVSKFTTELTKVQFAASYLKGDAETWWLTIRKTSTVPTTFRLFDEAIREQFESPYKVKLARDELFALVQKGGSVRKYNDRFRVLATRIGNLAEEEALDRYERGLNVELQKEVMRAGCTTLAKAMYVAQQFDSLNYGIRRREQLRYGETGNNGHTPMDLSAINHSKKNNKRLDLTTEQVKGRIAARVCINCNKPGHQKKQCKSDFVPAQ